MSRRPIGTDLQDDDLRTVLGASAGAAAAIEQRMREAAPSLGLPMPSERATPERRAAPPPSRPDRLVVHRSPVRASTVGSSAPVARVAPQPPAPPPLTRSVIDELERLGELKQRGLLSDDEFVAFKRRLLSDR